MNEDDRDDRSLRGLLLGRLGEEERDALEARLLADGALAEHAALLEDEMAEAYAGATMSSPDREAFAERLVRVPRLRERVARARAFDALAGRPPLPGPVQPARPTPIAPTWTRRLWAALRPPAVAVPWALATSVLVAVAGVVSRQQMESQRRETAAMRAERDAARAEALRLASGGAAVPPPAFILSPGTARDEAEITTLRLAAGGGPVRLLLDLDHPSGGKVYRALLRDAAGAQVFARTGLFAAARDGMEVLEVQLDSGLLPAGRYELRLETLDGANPRPAGTYLFRAIAP